MVYDLSNSTSTKMAKSQSLFTSCKTFNNDLTETQFRQNIDLAFRITNEFKEKNKAVEPEYTVDYSNACPFCGGPIKISGTCWVCYAGCGESAGGCS